MAELISYIKRPVKGAWINFKSAHYDLRIIDVSFLDEDLLQKLNHFSPRSDQALVEVVQFFQKISYTTDPTAPFPPDHPYRSKLTPDNGGLQYVFNQSIRTVTALLYLHVQSRSPNNEISLSGEVKRASNWNILLFFCFIKPPEFRTSISFHLSSKQPILSDLKSIYGTQVLENSHSRQAIRNLYIPCM
ncbi:hypothetical protein O181_074907 [Austropuccinia psidii MF-1]|uniref:Uncharacterized protein n=1 Tax=Austropuccinia psidii MF-1 TaxID=1389203 RepID=A0A9Q3FBR1_9BASI|nr:hypothetical protein [Austropuccinia psidii MF-1]